MPILNQVVLYSHILAGAAILVFGTYALATKPGGKSHRLVGKIFFWSMAWIFISTIYMVSAIRFNLFLLIIGIFSFYLSFSAYRVLYRKKKDRVHWMDWTGAILTLLAGMVMLGLALWVLQHQGLGPSVYLCGIFGFFTVQLAWKDIKVFRTGTLDNPMWWLYQHMSGMGGAYIAGITAFLVQASGRWFPHWDGQWIVWVIPGVLGGILLSMYVGSYRKKHKKDPRQDPQIAR
ncbi:MAG: hypothetical protein AAGH79_06135 [Bacteroidota bacterium]